MRRNVQQRSLTNSPPYDCDGGATCDGYEQAKQQIASAIRALKTITT